MLINLIAPFLLAGLAVNAPLSADEQAIFSHCVAEGASEAECACGIDAAREIMTPREVSLVAELAPELSGETSLDSALARAPQLIEEHGFSLAEFGVAMQKVVTYSDTVEQRCADPAPGPAPAPAAGAAQ